MIARLRRRVAWWLLSFDHDSVPVPFIQTVPWSACPLHTTTAATGRAIYVYSGQKVPCA